MLKQIWQLYNIRKNYISIDYMYLPLSTKKSVYEKIILAAFMLVGLDLAHMLTRYI
jgi:hypothetical protein